MRLLDFLLLQQLGLPLDVFNLIILLLHLLLVVGIGAFIHDFDLSEFLEFYLSDLLDNGLEFLLILYLKLLLLDFDLLPDLLNLELDIFFKLLHFAFVKDIG